MTFFDILWWILLILYVPACIGLIVIVLLQKGKGTSFAGAVGVGAGSETVFGPRASQSLPVRLTYVAAATFMVIALVMSIISGKIGKGSAPELVEGVSAAIAAPKSLLEKGVGGVELEDDADGTVSPNPKPISEDAQRRIRERLRSDALKAPEASATAAEEPSAAEDPGDSTGEDTP